MKKQIFTWTKCPKFILQIDKSTNVAGLPQLLIFISFCFEENISVVFMFSRMFIVRTTESDMLKTVNEHDVNSDEMSWSCCVGICTAGAAGLKGFEAEVRQLCSTRKPYTLCHS